MTFNSWSIINIVIVLSRLDADTDLGSSDQPVALCTAVQVIALKQLLLHKHVPQSLLQAGHATNTHCQVQEVLLKKRNGSISCLCRVVVGVEIKTALHFIVSQTEKKRVSACHDNQGK